MNKAKYINYRLLIVLLLCFVVNKTCFCQSEEGDEEEEIVEKKVSMFHQYFAEHSFVDLNHVDHGLTVKSYPIISPPIFGIGLKWKVNDFMFIGFQSTFGVSRENITISNIKNNTKNNYTIDTWSYKRTVALGLKLSENNSLSMLFGASINIDFDITNSNYKDSKSKEVIISDTFNYNKIHIGLEYEYKPYKDKKEKFFWQLICPINQKVIRVYDSSSSLYTQNYKSIFYQPFILNAGVRF